MLSARPETRAASTNNVMQVRITATISYSQIAEYQPFVASFSSCTSPDGQNIGSALQCNSLAAHTIPAQADLALSIAERSYSADFTVVTADGVSGGSQVDIAICYELQDSVCSQRQRSVAGQSLDLCTPGHNSKPSLSAYQADTGDNAYTATTRVVFAAVEDSDTPYSQVNNHYEVSCPHVDRAVTSSRA